MTRGRPPLEVGETGRVWFTGKAPQVTARVRLRDPDGKIREASRSGTGKADAERKLRKFLERREPPRSISNALLLTRDSTMEALATAWLADIDKRDKHSVGTKSQYREVVNKHVTPALGSLRIREATPGRVKGVLDSITDEDGNPKSATINRTRSVIAGMFRWAIALDLAAANPVSEYRAPVKQRQAVAALSADRIREIRLKTRADEIAVKQHVADVIDVLAATGARVGEVLALRWEDIDLDSATLTITGTIVPGPPVIRQDHTKTRDIRKLTLPDWCVRVLRARQPLALPNDLGLVFPNERGKPWDPSGFRRFWRDCCDRHGWDRINPHQFRKSVATLLANEGADLETAAAQLGHSGTSVTAKHYVAKVEHAPDSRHLLDRFNA